MTRVASFTLRTAFAGVLVLATAGCHESGSSRAGSRAAPAYATFSDVFAVEDTTVLEENVDVINVTPNVEIDGDSLYLIADEREKQLRIYERTGALAARFGRQGQGPGEFFAPVRLVRLKSGNLLASDLLSRFTLYSAEGDSLIGTRATPFTRIFDVDPVADSVLLVAGILRSSPGERLHIFRLSDTTVVRSFLTVPSLPPAALDAAGFATSTVRNDTIYAVLSLVDSIYRFSITGERFPPIHVAGIRFRPLPPQLPPPGATQREIVDWFSSFSLLTHAIPLTNGFLLIYQDRREMMPVWHAAILNREGVAVADVSDAPLYVGLFSDGRLAFVRPDSETPNRWAIVTLTGQIRRALAAARD